VGYHGKQAHRNESRRHVKELEEKEQTLSQIIQGSTTPTFVINRNHIVTHWNKALEKLTGYTADEMVGTNHHWKPFRKKARPIMADVILDQLETGEISQYYGTKWRPSKLVEGAYEAEEFFEHLGENGRWLIFTAAPIKASDGTLVGPSKPCGTPRKKAHRSPAPPGYHAHRGE
jgi:PAS domain S-box-containing protein